MFRIAIHGVPRSGTTWLGEIFNSSPEVIFKYQPLFSYALKGYLTETSSRDQIGDFFVLLQNTNDTFLDQADERSTGDLPTFDKTAPTHVVYKEVRYHQILPNLARQSDDKTRLVLLIRNPLAVISSWLDAPKEFRRDQGWNESEEWRHAPKKNLSRPEEFNGFEKWKEATRLFLQLKKSYGECVAIVYYRDLLSRPVDTVRDVFEFCNLPFGKQTEAFLASSQSTGNDKPYSVYRPTTTTDDKWRERLSEEIIQSVSADLTGTELEDLLK